jgi:predicted anti-sigma-YlaC factor YlaD
MTCNQIRELIDLVPHNQHRPQTRHIIEAHAQSCEYCQSALAAEASLAAMLHELPETRTPSNTASIVLARIAVIDEQRAEAAAKRAPAAARHATWRPWTALAGLGAMLVIHLQATVGEQVGFNLLSPIIGFEQGGVLTGVYSAPVALGFAVALSSYLAGVFSAIRTDE